MHIYIEKYHVPTQTLTSRNIAPIELTPAHHVISGKDENRMGRTHQKAGRENAATDIPLHLLQSNNFIRKIGWN